jgi:hypothetical protein
MTHETEELIERWIMTFLEPPPVADPALMAEILADYEEDRAQDLRYCAAS